MLRLATHCIVLAAVAVMVPPAQAAPAMTPARYVECQIYARHATLTGIQERAALQRRLPTESELRKSEELAQARVTQAIASCGSTVAALGAYGYRHGEEIRAWLDANPAKKAQMDALGASVMTQGEQLRRPLRVLPPDNRRER